jgi:putative flippase GtrA
MVHLITARVDRVRHLVPELAKFGVVGATGSVVDLGGSALLYGTFHLGPITSKAIALTAACVVTYLGSRFWTFRNRENQAVHRELILFIVLNLIGLVIAEIVIGMTAYVFGAKDQLAYNAASVIGTGIGTIFRFWAYRKWVFLAPAGAAGPADPADLAAADPAAAAAAATTAPASPVSATRTATGSTGASPSPAVNGQPRNGAPVKHPRVITPNVTVLPARVSPPSVAGERRPEKWLRGTSTGLPSLPARRVTGQEHREDRRLAPSQDDPAAIGGRHRPGQGKPQAGTLRPPADAALEDARHQLGGHAAALVLDLDHR